MRWSLAHVLDAAAPHLDVRLAAPRELTRARSLLASLPAAISDWIYLEFRLSPRDARIDVIVRVDEAHRHRLACGSPWQRANAFARMWADPEVGWNRAIENLWLEFDLEGAASDESPHLHEPRFFVDFTSSIRNDPSPDIRWRVACDAIAPLCPEALPSEVTQSLRRTLHALPCGASLLSVGLPHGAAMPGLRVCLTGVATSDLSSFLRAAGWACDGGGVSEVLHQLFDAPGGAGVIDLVDLDLTSDGRGALSIELGFARKPQLRGAIEERHLLERLAACHAIDAASIDALGAWPGYERARLAHVFWPALLVRRINHVKLMFEDGRISGVKAYLCVFHRFSRPIAPRLYSIDRALDCEVDRFLPDSGTAPAPLA